MLHRFSGIREEKNRIGWDNGRYMWVSKDQRNITHERYTNVSSGWMKPIYPIYAATILLEIEKINNNYIVGLVYNKLI